MAVDNYHSNLSWFQLVFSFQQKATRLDVNQSGGKLDLVIHDMKYIFVITSCGKDDHQNEQQYLIFCAKSGEI